MWTRILAYGLLLAAGTLALQWLDYRRLARAHTEEVYVFLIAAGFLALGIYIGARALGSGKPAPFDGNPQAQAALGISARELEVLKEIAAKLDVSPNTVKTHVARLYEKLDAKRRTDALRKARELGLMP